MAPKLSEQTSIFGVVFFVTITIYMGKPEIPVGKSNRSRHSVWEASENMGCDLR